VSTLRLADLKPVALGESYGFDLFSRSGSADDSNLCGARQPTNSDQLESAEGGGGSLRALLFAGSGAVSRAKNNGTERITDVRGRFPPSAAMAEGVVTRAVERLEPGETVTLRVPLTRERIQRIYVDGPEYDVAQVDYRDNCAGGCI